jgi:hypothetical protein
MATWGQCLPLGSFDFDLVAGILQNKALVGQRCRSWGWHLGPREGDGQTLEEACLWTTNVEFSFVFNELNNRIYIYFFNYW